MALTDVAQIQYLSDTLGAADTALQAVINTSDSSSAISKVILARQRVHAQAAESDFDNADVLQGIIRTAESRIPASINDELTTTIKGIEAYYVAQTLTKTRILFKTGVTWADSFRKLWARAMKEELIVRIGSISKASGAWGSYTPDKSITTNTAMELRTASLIGSASITVTLVMLRLDGTTDLVLITVPASTASGAIFRITGGLSKWNSVQSMTCSGGTDADALEIWVS